MRTVEPTTQIIVAMIEAGMFSTANPTANGVRMPGDYAKAIAEAFTTIHSSVSVSSAPKPR